MAVNVQLEVRGDEHYLRAGRRAPSDPSVIAHQVIDAPVELYQGASPADAHDMTVPGLSYRGASRMESILRANLASGNWGSSSAILSVPGMIQTPQAQTGSPTLGYGNVVENVHLHGGCLAGSAYQLNTALQVWHAGQPFLCHGVVLRSNRSWVKNLSVELLRGYAVVIKSGFGSGLRAVDDVWFNRCFGGVYVDVSDVIVRDLEGEGIRDYGVWIENAGNVKIEGGHIYGCGAAAVRFGGGGNAGPCHAVGVDGSDSPYGFLNSVVGSWYENCYSQGGSTACYSTSARASYIGCRARIKHDGARGFHVNGPGTTLVGVHVDHDAARANTVGIEILQHATSVRGATLLGSNGAGQVGLLINAASLTGAVFEIDYAQGFTGSGAFAVKIQSWGANNTLRVNGLAFEVNTLVNVGSGWSGTIIRNGVALTPGTAYP